MNNQYITPETARLLKNTTFMQNGQKMEEWFWTGMHSYDETNKEHFGVYSGEYYPAPLKSVVMKWLRDEKKLHCDIGYDYLCNWYYQIVSLEEIVEYDYPEMKVYHNDNEVNFSSYEDAAEEAIKYCLNNLID